MTDPDGKDRTSKSDESDLHLKEGIESGRVTPTEAQIIQLFFASTRTENWPASNLQRRMQSSGG
jgi:hypothetical protein